MNKKFSWKNFNLLPNKQQRAVYTLAFSLLGFLLVVAVSSVLLFSVGSKNPKTSSVSESGSTSNSSSGAIEDPIAKGEFEGTILKPADNTDADYIKQTLFIGDSNTERLMEYGAISIDSFVGKAGLGITNAGTEACVYFKDDQTAYTIPQAVAKMKPRRVIITLGTNDSGESMKVDTFITAYENFVKAIQTAYPYCDIIINSIPPVTKQRTYKNIDMDKINTFNKALASMAMDKNYKFLNSSESLRDTDGYGKVNYFTKDDGIHLVESGAKAMVESARKHPYVSQDRRPDTKGVPSRRPAPAAVEPPASSSKVEEVVKGFTATYSVQADAGKAMGYLKSEKFESKNSYTHTFTKEAASFTVTAVANEGYVFDTWSDGVKDEKRTDANVQSNVKYTAQFKKKVALVLNVDKAAAISAFVGDTVKFTATITGDGADVNKIVWKMDGVVISAGAPSCDVKFDKEGTIKIAASYEGVEKPIEIAVTVTKAVATTVTFAGGSTATVGDAAVTFTASVTGTGADENKVQWIASDSTGAALASFTGKTFAYTPDRAGAIKITATLNGVSASQILTVTAKVVAPVVTVAINGPLIVDDGESCAFQAIVTNGDANSTVWTVDGVAVANGASFSRAFNVNNNAITTYAIVAKVGTVESKITLTVTPKKATSTP